MKKRVKIGIFSAFITLGIGSIIAASVTLTKNNQNDIKIKLDNQPTSNDVAFQPENNQLNESSLLESLEETTEISREVNGIQVSRPLVAGQEVLKIIKKEQQENFDPHWYGYIVYDALDDNPTVTYEGIENVNLSVVGEYPFTINVVNKYKIKHSKTFIVKVMEEADFNNINNSKFEYSAYVINGNYEKAAHSSSAFGVDADWQLLLPIVVKKGQRIRFKQTNSSFNLTRNFTIFKALSKISDFTLERRRSNTPAPIFDTNDKNPKFSVDSENYFVEQKNDVYNYEAIYLIKSQKQLNAQQTPKYEVQIIDENDNVIENISENKHVPFYIYKNSEDNSYEEKFINFWKTNETGAIIRNKATTFITPKEDIEVLYRGQKPVSQITPEMLKEVNRNHIIIQKDYRDLNGLHDDVVHEPENMAINASVLAFAWRINKNANAYASGTTGFWLNNENYSVNDKSGSFGSGLWINNRVTNDLAPDFFKHEYGHIFQNGLSNGRNGGVGLAEVSNIFNFLYTDWILFYKRELEKIDNDDETSSLPKKEKEKIAYDNTWKNLKYLSTFVTTLYNPLLSVYESNVAQNKEYYKKFFTGNFDNYNDMRHTVFVKVFARYGWESLIHTNKKWRALRLNKIHVPGLVPDSPNIDFFVYFLSEYAQTDLSNFFEHYGFKPTMQVKRQIARMGWKQADMANLLLNTPEELADVIVNNDRVYYNTSLITNSMIKDNTRSASISVKFGDDHKEALMNRSAHLLKMDENNNVSFVQTQLINDNLITFNNLNAGLYKIFIPSYKSGEVIKEAEFINITLAKSSSEIAVANFVNFNENEFVKNQQNVPRNIDQLKSKANTLLESMLQSKIDINDNSEYFLVDLKILEIYKNKILAIKADDELGLKIKQYLENLQKPVYIWDTNNLERINISKNTNLKTLLSKFNLVFSNNFSNTRKPNLSDIEFTNLPFDKQNIIFAAGEYSIVFVDERNTRHEIVVEVSNE